MAEPVSAGGRRNSLTGLQRESELGAELLSLCQSVTADGTLTSAEVMGLREWVNTHTADDMPAISHLRGILNRVLADGKISPEEFTEVYAAVEAVLPTGLRREAREARRERVRAEREAFQAARAEARLKTRGERDRNRPIGTANFMVAGVRHDGRPRIISRHVRPGDPAILRRERSNAFSRNAIAVYTASGHQVGFMPEVDASDWSGPMDEGAKVQAEFAKVLTGGQSPIPVVNARFYAPDADVQDPAATLKMRAKRVPRWLWWTILIVAAVWLLTTIHPA